MVQKRGLIDTNVLVRFLIGDHEAHLVKSKEIFRKAKSGIIELTLTTVVVAETCFVLESFYKLGKGKIGEAVGGLVSYKFMNIPERVVLIETLKRYAEGKHFVDAYLIAKSTKEDLEVISFDKKLKKSSKF